MKPPIISRLGRALTPWRSKQAFKPAQPTTRDWKETTDGIFLGLEDFLHDETGRFASTLRVISLAAFRDAVDADWERLKGRVMLIAESIIQRRIGHGNAFAQQGEELFVLCYAESVPDAEARRKAEIITEEIGRKLIGAQFSGADRPLVHMASVDKDEVLNPDGSLDLRALAGEIHAVRKAAGDLDAAPMARERIKAIEKEGDEIAARFHVGGDMADSRDSWADGRSFLGADGENPDDGGPAGPVLHATNPAAGRDAESWARDRSFMKGGGPTKADDEGPARSFLNTATATETPGAEEAEAPAIRLTFRPVWDAASQRIATCIATPTLYPSAQTPDDAAGYDAAYLAEVMGNLDSLAPGAILIAAIRFTSWAVHRRAPLVEALNAQPTGLRQARLIVEITDPPNDAGPEDIALAVRNAAAHCQAVFLRLPANDSAAVRAATGAGARALGLDLSGLKEDLEQTIAAFRHDLKIASQNPEPVYAWGLDRRAGLRAALKSKFDYLSGSVLLKAAPRPGPIVRLARERIVAALDAAGATT